MTARDELVRALAAKVAPGATKGEFVDQIAVETATTWVDAFQSLPSALVRAFLSEADFPETKTVRVNVSEVDRAAYRLACLAWPSEADDHRQRWFRRIVFEPDQLKSVYGTAVERCSVHGVREIERLVCIVRDAQERP